MAFEPSICIVEQIGSGFLAVMPRPTPGEWIEDEFAGIAAFGIDRLVSLLEMPEAIELGLGNEAELCAKNQIEFVSYPIVDRGIPESPVAFGRFCLNLYETIGRGANTVVHCRAGIGRSGIVAAGVLLHAAFKSSEAFAHISKARGIEVPDTKEQRDWIITNSDKILSLYEPPQE